MVSVTSLGQNLLCFHPFFAVTTGIAHVSYLTQHLVMVFVWNVLPRACYHERKIPVVRLEIGFGKRGQVGRHRNDFAAFSQPNAKRVATFVTNPFGLVEAANLRTRNLKQHAGSSATILRTKRRFSGTIFTGLTEFDNPVVGVCTLLRNSPRTTILQPLGQHIRAISKVTQRHGWTSLLRMV